jgi:hypothetical protein
VPITFAGGFAADGRAENSRVRPNGQELATVANANLAKVTDLTDARDKSR